MTSDSAAHLLFPNDAPAGQQRAPEWFAAKQNAATAGLMRTEKPAAADPAALVFPNEAPKVDGAPAGANNAEKKGFPDPPEKFGDGRAQDFFSGFAASAAADGDGERARALNAAGEALVENARAAGTDAAELGAALDIVKERQGDTIAEITSEKLEADFASGMATLQAELGDSLSGDLAAARSFIADLDKIAPGTIDTLNRTGAGNDPRLIRKAIAEAKRRGYRGSAQ